MLAKIKYWVVSLSTLFILSFPAVSSADIAPCTDTPWVCGLKNAKGAGLPDQPIYNIISNTLGWLLAILGFIAIGAFVISGLLYLTSAGNENQAEQAKSAMKFSIIGIIVALVGWIAIRAITSLLNAQVGF